MLNTERQTVTDLTQSDPLQTARHLLDHSESQDATMIAVGYILIEVAVTLRAINARLRDIDSDLPNAGRGD
jgi:hypothetical protein